MLWRVGIIGAGSYGAQHAEALAALDNVVMVAASRTNADALRDFTDRYGGTGYAAYSALLADPAVDVVVIATPHDRHTEIAVQAARAGKHILLEKPMAPTLAECHQIIAAAQSAGVKLMVGHVNHFVPAYQVAKALLDSGEMGEVVHGLATMQKYWYEANRREWHLDRAQGGGVWLTVGVHPLDRLTWLINRPIRQVSAQFQTRFHAQQSDDAGVVLVRYAGGAAGIVVSTGYATGAPKHLTELTCTKGMLNIDYTGGVWIGRDENWTQVPGSAAEGQWMHAALVAQWRGFLQALTADTETPVSGTFAAHIMEACFAAERSSREQREIPVESDWFTLSAGHTEGG